MLRFLSGVIFYVVIYYQYKTTVHQRPDRAIGLMIISTFVQGIALKKSLSIFLAEA